MVYYGLAVRYGRNPWVRWSVGTKGAPVTLPLLLRAGHPANVRWYALALTSIPLHVMVLSRFSHLVSVGTSFLRDLRSRSLAIRVPENRVQV